MKVLCTLDDVAHTLSPEPPPVNPSLDLAGADVAARLTVIVTTSPVRSNPSTELLEHVMGSFALLPGLEDCTKIIVGDGCTVSEKSAHKSGKVTEEESVSYKLYLDNLRQLAARGTAPGFRRTRVLELHERWGFGYAIKAALAVVHTPYVMVVQHDRAFVRALDLPAVLRAMDSAPDIQYVGFPTTSTKNYPLRFTGRGNVHGVISSLKPRAECGLPLLPLIFWYDSTHVCKAEYYRNFVFGYWPGGVRLRRGDFIEDTLGQHELLQIKEHGMEAHKPYGTFLLQDGLGLSVGHIDGRKFLTKEKRQELGWKGRRLPAPRDLEGVVPSQLSSPPPVKPASSCSFSSAAALVSSPPLPPSVSDYSHVSSLGDVSSPISSFPSSSSAASSLASSSSVAVSFCPSPILSSSEPALPDVQSLEEPTQETDSSALHAHRDQG